LPIASGERVVAANTGVIGGPILSSGFLDVAENGEESSDLVGSGNRVLLVVVGFGRDHLAVVVRDLNGQVSAMRTRIVEHEVFS